MMPIEAIKIEASVPLICLHLDQCARHAAIRLNKLSTHNSVIQCLDNRWRAGRNPINPPPLPVHRMSKAVNELKKMMQLQQLATMTDLNDERLYPFSELVAPWRHTKWDYGERLIISRTNGQSKDEAAYQHNSDIKRLQTHDHLLVYIDGSQCDI